MKKIITPYVNCNETKKNQIIKMFDEISKTYDILNRIISLGIDCFWRRKIYEIIKKFKHEFILDIATGTGDLIIELSKLEAKKIIGIDISPKMLEIGVEKLKKKGLSKKITMLLGDSENLQFEDQSFDVITVAFGVRNFENLDKALNEIKRVLKPRGILIILETAIPKNKIVRLTYNLYTKFIMPVIGFIFSKKFYAYNYLSKSAEVFPYGKSFNNILKKNGFIDVEDSPQTLGVASIYFAKKI